MRELLQPFVLTVTAILSIAYTYLTWRLTSRAAEDLALAIPFVLVWAVPVLYWGGKRSGESSIDKVVLQASFLSMGWLSFLVVLTLGRDAILVLTLWPPLASAHEFVRDSGVPMVLTGSLLALGVGVAYARLG